MACDYKVSIIIPVYNAASYLSRCMESILAQTYTNLEIIMVNDGSTDGSGDICRKYAGQDERIIVIDQPNSGVVSARQKGTAAAAGEFIGCVDADDWIEPDLIRTLVMLQQKSDADIVASAHFHDIGQSSSVVTNGIGPGVYGSDQIIGNMLYTGRFYEYGITPQLYTKIFRNRILKNTQAAVPGDIIAGDDAAVVYPSILKAEKICVTDAAGYHYVQHLNSITKNSYENERERVDILIRYLKRIFAEQGVLGTTENQLTVYRNYLLALRQIEVFDEGEEMLTPFGGSGKADRIIIYGAGVLGQKIYRYLKGKNYNVVGWLDKNHMVYRSDGMEVDPPEKIKSMTGGYDYVIIANITQNAAGSIRNYLEQDLEVPAGKIRWFSEEFRGCRS